MRSGDIITSRRKHKWIVGHAVEEGAYECLGKGRHFFLVRDIDADSGPDLLFTLRPECELRKGWKRNHFEIGYSSAPYQDGSVVLLRQDVLFIAMPAADPCHPFIETVDGQMMVKAPAALAELFVTVQHDHDNGSSDHLALWRWQFALMVSRDRDGKPPIDFSKVQGRIALPEEI